MSILRNALCWHFDVPREKVCGSLSDSTPLYLTSPAKRKHEKNPPPISVKILQLQVKTVFILTPSPSLIFGANVMQVCNRRRPIHLLQFLLSFLPFYPPLSLTQTPLPHRNVHAELLAYYNRACSLGFLSLPTDEPCGGLRYTQVTRLFADYCLAG